MNILFLSLTSYDTLSKHNIYTDLLREFKKDGHKIYAVCPVQRRTKMPTRLIEEDGAAILQVRTGNITKANLIEKGLSTMMIGRQFIRAIKKHFGGVTFDLILYPTPPITLVSVVKYFKNKDHAKTYLMLKDIFPQNAVDIGMMSKSGVKGMLYKRFRRQEKELYEVSDRIGCMSQANCDYVLQHNPEVDPSKVEICPNAVEVVDMRITAAERAEIREKYGIPNDRKVFVYGGNLGRPQGIPFLLDCLKAQAEKKNGAYFLIVGSGTEYGKLQAWFDGAKPENMKLMNRLPKEDYDKMVAGCDVGMVFLDHRFTIPNFPSRILSYMQAGLPILACTDPNTDVGRVITEGGFGWWCESNDAEAFSRTVEAAVSADCAAAGEKAYDYLCTNFTADKVYSVIMESCAFDGERA